MVLNACLSVLGQTINKDLRKQALLGALRDLRWRSAVVILELAKTVYLNFYLISLLSLKSVKHHMRFQDYQYSKSPSDLTLAMVVSGVAMKVPGKIHKGSPDVELLDFGPVKDRGPLPKVADLPNYMVGAVSAFVGGKAVICGGAEPWWNHCYTYFPKANQWKSTMPMDFLRYNFAYNVDLVSHDLAMTEKFRFPKASQRDL